VIFLLPNIIDFQCEEVLLQVILLHLQQNISMGLMVLAFIE